MKFLPGIMFSCVLFVGLLIYGFESRFLLHSLFLSKTPASRGSVATTTSIEPVREQVREVAALQKKKQSIADVPQAFSTSEPVVAATTSSPVSEATSTASSTLSYSASLEQEVHIRVNALRAASGLSALAWSDSLALIARTHSADMQENDYFDHTNETGCSSSCRASNAGYLWRAIGENIYMMGGYKLSALEAAQKIVEGWSESPGHLANMLSDAYIEQGIGVSTQGSELYVTELLAKPR